MSVDFITVQWLPHCKALFSDDYISKNIPDRPCCSFESLEKLVPKYSYRPCIKSFLIAEYFEWSVNPSLHTDPSANRTAASKVEPKQVAILLASYLEL